MNLKSIVLLASMCFWLGTTAFAQASPDAMRNLQAQFESETLTADDIKAFEDRAVQKVYDLYNYRNVMAQPAYELAMRKKAHEQALGLFAQNSDCTWGSNTPPKVVLDEWLKLGLAGEYWYIDRVMIETNLAEVNKDEWRGTVTYFLNHPDMMLDIARSPMELEAMQIQERCEIVLRKTEKQFGKEKRMVWEVYLCTISDIQKN